MAEEDKQIARLHIDISPLEKELGKANKILGELGNGNVKPGKGVSKALKEIEKQVEDTSKGIAEKMRVLTGSIEYVEPELQSLMDKVTKTTTSVYQEGDVTKVVQGMDKLNNSLKETYQNGELVVQTFTEKSEWTKQIENANKLYGDQSKILKQLYEYQIKRLSAQDGSAMAKHLDEEIESQQHLSEENKKQADALDYRVREQSKLVELFKMEQGLQEKLRTAEAAQKDARAKGDITEQIKEANALYDTLLGKLKEFYSVRTRRLSAPEGTELAKELESEEKALKTQLRVIYDERAKRIDKEIIAQSKLNGLVKQEFDLRDKYYTQSKITAATNKDKELSGADQYARAKEVMGQLKTAYDQQNAAVRSGREEEADKWRASAAYYEKEAEQIKNKIGNLNQESEIYRKIQTVLGQIETAKFDQGQLYKPGVDLLNTLDEAQKKLKLFTSEFAAAQKNGDTAAMAAWNEKIQAVLQRVPSDIQAATKELGAEQDTLEKIYMLHAQIQNIQSAHNAKTDPNLKTYQELHKNVDWLVTSLKNYNAVVEEGSKKGQNLWRKQVDSAKAAVEESSKAAQKVKEQSTYYNEIQDELQRLNAVQLAQDKQDAPGARQLQRLQEIYRELKDAVSDYGIAQANSDKKGTQNASDRVAALTKESAAIAGNITKQEKEGKIAADIQKNITAAQDKIRNVKISYEKKSAPDLEVWEKLREKVDRTVESYKKYNDQVAKKGDAQAIEYWKKEGDAAAKAAQTIINANKDLSERSAYYKDIQDEIQRFNVARLAQKDLEAPGIKQLQQLSELYETLTEQVNDFKRAQSVGQTDAMQSAGERIKKTVGEIAGLWDSLDPKKMKISGDVWEQLSSLNDRIGTVKKSYETQADANLAAFKKSQEVLSDLTFYVKEYNKAVDEGNSKGAAYYSAQISQTARQAKEIQESSYALDTQSQYYRDIQDTLQQINDLQFAQERRTAPGAKELQQLLEYYHQLTDAIGDYNAAQKNNDEEAQTKAGNRVAQIGNEIEKLQDQISTMNTEAGLSVKIANLSEKIHTARTAYAISSDPNLKTYKELQGVLGDILTAQKRYNDAVKNGNDNSAAEYASQLQTAFERAEALRSVVESIGKDSAYFKEIQNTMLQIDDARFIQDRANAPGIKQLELLQKYYAELTDATRLYSDAQKQGSAEAVANSQKRISLIGAEISRVQEQIEGIQKQNEGMRIQDDILEKISIISDKIATKQAEHKISTDPNLEAYQKLEAAVDRVALSQKNYNDLVAGKGSQGGINYWKQQRTEAADQAQQIIKDNEGLAQTASHYRDIQDEVQRFNALQFAYQEQNAPDAQRLQELQEAYKKLVELSRTYANAQKVNDTETMKSADAGIRVTNAEIQGIQDRIKQLRDEQAVREDVLKQIDSLNDKIRTTQMEHEARVDPNLSTYKELLGILDRIAAVQKLINNAPEGTPQAETDALRAQLQTEYERAAQIKEENSGLDAQATYYLEIKDTLQQIDALQQAQKDREAPGAKQLQETLDLYKEIKETSDAFTTAQSRHDADAMRQFSARMNELAQKFQALQGQISSIGIDNIDEKLVRPIETAAEKIKSVQAAYENRTDPGLLYYEKSKAAVSQLQTAYQLLNSARQSGDENAIANAEEQVRRSIASRDSILGHVKAISEENAYRQKTLDLIQQANTAEAVQASKNAPGTVYFKQTQDELKKLTDAYKLYDQAQKAGNTSAMNFAVTNANAAMNQILAIEQNIDKLGLEESERTAILGQIEKAKVAEQLHTQAVEENAKGAAELSKTYQQIVRTLESMATMYVMRGLKELWTSAKDYASEYYDKMNEIRIITNDTEEEANQLGDSYRELARRMSVSSTEVANAAVEFWRQGLGESEVNERLVNATQYAKIAAMNFDEAAEIITAATNSMDLDAQRVVDVFSYLGDASASGKQYCPCVQ